MLTMQMLFSMFGKLLYEHSSYPSLYIYCLGSVGDVRHRQLLVYVLSVWHLPNTSAQLCDMRLTFVFP